VRARTKAILLAPVAVVTVFVLWVWSLTYMHDGGRLSPRLALGSRLVALAAHLPPKRTDPKGRAMFDDLIERVQRVDPPVAGVTIEDLAIPAAHGAIPIRLYRAAAGEGPRPIVVFYHGGGWVVGSIRTHDNLCRYLAQLSGALVVSVDYRLAPEHPYPAGFDDAYAALAWSAENAARLGGDARHLAIAGDSAGGNLAAAVALKARDQAGPRIKLQVLLYPVLDLVRFERPSYTVLAASGYGIQPSQLAHNRAMYLPAGADPADPYVSPLAAKSLAGLPPALVILPQYDSLRDEGIEFAEKLRAAGGEAEAIVYPGMVHGFVSLHREVTESAAALATIAARLRK